MRKIIAFDWVSVDGFYAGPNREIDWILQDPEIDKAAHERMSPERSLYTVFPCDNLANAMFGCARAVPTGDDMTVWTGIGGLRVSLLCVEFMVDSF